MCTQPMHELSLYHLNLILLLSSLIFLEGRCHSSPGDWSAYQSAFSYKSFQCDCPLNSMTLVHFTFVFLLLGIFLGTLLILRRLLLVSSLLKWLFRFFISFLIHLRISSNQRLVFGRFDGAHHSQFILLLGEGFHELNNIRHLLGSSYQFSGIKGQKKHWIVRTNLWENGRN